MQTNHRPDFCLDFVQIAGLLIERWLSLICISFRKFASLRLSSVKKTSFTNFWCTHWQWVTLNNAHCENDFWDFQVQRADRKITAKSSLKTDACLLNINSVDLSSSFTWTLWGCQILKPSAFYIAIAVSNVWIPLSSWPKLSNIPELRTGEICGWLYVEQLAGFLRNTTSGLSQLSTLSIFSKDSFGYFGYFETPTTVYRARLTGVHILAKRFQANT